ncbi:MAG: hypothetical protein WDW36_005246 [Sanguina aurantia]
MRRGLYCQSVRPASVLDDQATGGLVFTRSKYTYKFKKAASMPGLIYWKPRTPGQRHKISIDFVKLGVYTGPPHKDLSAAVAKTGGRDGKTGRITCRGKGGGDAKVLRNVDYTRSDLDGVPGVVQRIEYDPNRTAFLALVRYEPAGQLPVFRYHVAPASVAVGDIMNSGRGAPITPGSVLQIRDIPLGVPIHNLEIHPGKGGQMVRAANTHAIIQAKQEKFAIIKLPSGESRLVDLACRATVGLVSNHLNKMVNLGKAGAKRKLGRRPITRGVAMNPIDHPHGGDTSGGRVSCSPWGVYAKGKRTRSRNKWTNKFILVRKGGQAIDKFVNAKKWRAAAARQTKIANAAGGGGAAAVAAAAAAAAGADDKSKGRKKPALVKSVKVATA